MLCIWQKFGSLFRTADPVSAHQGQSQRPPGGSRVISVVALIVNPDDRAVVEKISGAKDTSREAWEVHFAESCEEAAVLAQRLSAPVILFDRDWSGIEWKSAVSRLAALPPHACLVLLSGVADTYLWQELVRHDGYDILAKPLRLEDVLRVVKLALSYRSIRTQPAVEAIGRK